MQRASIFLFLVFFTAESKDLGIFGETFQILEKDLLEEIMLKLKKMERTGKLEAEKEKVERRVKEMILHPYPIADIAHTQSRKEYTFDPTIAVTRDLSDHRGRIFAHRGMRFNPLDKINMSKPLLFIDGDDVTHVKWAISKINENNLGKIILVKGSPSDLQKQLRREVYFDQQGLITAKLGIRHVPAIVFQKTGKKVLTVIEEVSTEEEN
jgi:conjugal transfer pilus assembly protein TraW